MEKRLTRVLYSKDLTNHADLIVQNVSGIYLATLKASEDVIYFKKNKVLLTIDIEHYGEFQITRPVGSKQWNELKVGDTFVFQKKMITDKKSGKKRATLLLRYVFDEVDWLHTIDVKDITELPSPDSKYPNITQLRMLKYSQDELLVYSNNYVYRVPNNFSFDNYKKLDITFGTLFYVNNRINDERKIKIVSLDFMEAREEIYTGTNELQNDADKQTFNVSTPSKDEFIDFHKSSNIEIIDREFTGLFLMKIINVTTSVRDNKERRYADVVINGLNRVTLRIPERIEWQNLQSNQHILVEKTIHVGDDGTKLALLDVALRVDGFDEQEIVELTSLTKHKHGSLSYAQFHFIQKIDTYYIVLSRYKLYKVEVKTLPDEVLRALMSGYTRFFIRDTGSRVCFGREETIRVKLC